MNKRKIWSTMLSLVVTIAILTIFGGVAVSADASVVESGNCGANGDNVTYTLYDDGLLVISGTGDMNSDFEYASGVPWYDHGNASSIKKVVIESGVTSIGRYAFFYCSNLTSITAPNTLTKIDYRAFYGSGLESISIPDGVISIGDEAFYNCDSLETVEISATVASFGAKVFEACDNLTTVAFASTGNIEVIPAETFKECKKLTTVYLPSGVISIGDNAFSYCYELETVTIPDTVTSIGNSAFYNCHNLTDCALPNSILSIGDNAFYSCEKLAFPNFPNKIESIGTYAFAYCYGMTLDLVIPDTVTNLGTFAFYYCENISSVTLPASDKIQFDSIPTGCFMFLKKIESVDIPSGITSIGDSAFTCCYELSSISIPASVTSIGNYTFSSCYALETIDLPNTITSIGREAFYHTGLTTVTIPNSITEIAEGTFKYCDALETVNIPDSVTTIGNSAFEQCTSLETIDLPAGLTTLGQEVFRECRGLKSIVIPSGITSIEALTFCYCTNLESVTLPDTLEAIRTSAFYGCFKLKSIDLPASLKILGISAFAINSSDEPAGLESIDLPEGVTIESDSWGNGAQTFENTNITTVTIPGSITTVPAYMFKGCKKLQSVTFGEGVETIEGSAFEYSNNIKTVVIPSTVTYIGYHAFGSGKSITDIYCYADPNTLTMSIGVNNNVNSNTKFHVPAQYLNDYKDKFPGLANNFVGDADGTINIGGSTHLCGYTLSMDGNIGVNFYMTLGDDILNNSSTAYMQFIVNGKTQKVKVSDAKRDGVYYIFRCDTVAKEMTDTISARMFISEGNPDGDAYTYSVRDYAVYILNHQNDFGAKTVAVVKAMLNYGASAQKFFGYKLDNLANSVLSDNDRKIPYVDPTAMVFTSSAKVVNADIKLEKVSLSLKSEITMKLYFSGNTSGVDFYVGPTKLKVSKSGSYTVVTITGIYAQNIGTGVNVDAYAGSTYLGSARCAPMRYCQLALTSNDAAVTPELKEVVSALYYYSQALIQYAG